MITRNDIKGKSVRQRGRPFPPNNTKGKPKINDKDIEPIPKSVQNTVDEKLKEPMNTLVEQAPEIKDESKELELIDSLVFKNGENNLTIRFSKKHNRMFRIQIFLNDESEIRPVTYTGASTGYSFWNLLKGALKK